MPRKSTRNAQGGGTIRQRKDGKWEARYTVGRNPGTGKQTQKSIYGETQKEVRQKLQKVLLEIDEGAYSEPSNQTVNAWLKCWLTSYLGNVKPGTVANYTQHVENHIIPAIGALKLTALHPTAIQNLYNKLQENGLSAKSIKNLHGALHRALHTATKLGYIRTNPTEACILPRIERKEIKPLDTEDISKFLNAIKDHRHETLFRVALFTGMRSGELLGLTWDCVRFDEGVIHINKQLTPPRRTGETYGFGSLKNDKPRTITPAPSIMQQLKKHGKEQVKQRMLIGAAWGEEGFENLVFTKENGYHLTQSGVWKMLQKVFTQANIEQRRFHDLRHTYAVNALRSGDDVKTVQETLGHHTAAFTLDIYGHVTNEMQKASADRMEAFINGIPAV